jgi:hypothetical protein
MLLLFSCDRKNISSPINETESQLVNKIDFFPESTTYKEITIDGQKVIEAQLPEGFFLE